MPYSYYSNLSAKNKRIYRASDAIDEVKLNHSNTLRPNVIDIKEALGLENKAKIQSSSQKLVTKLTQELKISPVKIKVLSRRPHNHYGELYGLYEPISPKMDKAEISVWMRTAKRKQVVAFKTYMRTLFHELCHHFDYELFNLEDSFHTEGFFKRESSLYKQLVI